MAKGDYYFPLYYQRLLSSCTGWKDDELGAYLRLLIYQFDNGGIPDDMEEITRIAPSARKNWPRLAKKFEKNEAGEFINPVMDEIRQSRLKKLETLKTNGARGGRPSKKPNGFNKEEEKKPNGYENKNQMVIENETNTNMVNGYWLEKEKEEGAEGEKTIYPDRSLMGIDLEKEDALYAIQYLEITCKKVLPEEDVIRQWKAFKIQYFDGTHGYESWADVRQHFRDWLKRSLQKQTNENNSKPAGKTSRKDILSSGQDTAAESLRDSLSELV